MTDNIYMQLALELAKKGLYTTRPNPCVGCVIVKDDRIIGQGYHPKAGQPHAEVFALKNAKENNEDTNGAIAYVTLEPCSHFGRTPPCANALIDAGISRVVIATLDPNPKVAGRGVKLLQDAGIKVTIGVLEDEATALNAGFLKAMASGLPYVRLKLATSLDGRVAMANGESKWITDEVSRLDVQRLRAMSAAIVTGSGTIMADNPSLTVRETIDGISPNQIPKPKIVILDRSSNIKPNDNYTVLQDSDTLIWRDDILPLLQVLVQDYQCYDVLVEAGATLASSFLLQGLVDELIVYQAPCLLGVDTKPMFLGAMSHLKDKLTFELKQATKLAQDVRLILTPKIVS